MWAYLAESKNQIKVFAFVSGLTFDISQAVIILGNT